MMIEQETARRVPDSTNQKKGSQKADQQAEQAAAPPNPSRARRILILLILLMAVGAGAFWIWRPFLAAPRVPDIIIVLSGRIEGDDSAIAPKAGGRIFEIRVREGDSVKAGETIAILDDQQIK